MPLFKPLGGTAAFGFPSFKVIPGAVTYNTIGVHIFEIPYYRILTIEMWGGGGSGGSTGTGQAASGTDSTLSIGDTIIMRAGGGAGGFQDYSDRWHRGHFTAAGGIGGGASGGDINLLGGHGHYGGWNYANQDSWGGDSGGFPDYGKDLNPIAGKGGKYWSFAGQNLGGGGGGTQYGGGGGKFSWACGGGGGGGYAKKTWNLRDIGRGSGLRFKTKWLISVGFGGIPKGIYDDGGKGGDGLVRISWH
jgi:hypothetical protein